MNETLAPYVKKLLDGGIKTAEDAAKFIETQTPELGKEVIMWGAISEAIAPIIGALLIAAAIFVHFKCKDYKWYCSDDSEFPVLLFVILGFIVGSIIFISQIMDVIYPLVAPRLYILDKISQFIK